MKLARNQKTEYELLELIGRFYSEKNIDIIRPYLHSNIGFYSTWVKERLNGAKSVLKYLTGKAETLKKHDSTIVFFIYPFVNRGNYFLLLKQGNENVLATIGFKRGKILFISLSPCEKRRIYPYGCKILRDCWKVIPQINRNMKKEIEIAKPKIKELEKLIYKPFVHQQNVEHMETMRIENDPEYTRIDFLYYACPRYVDGGWIQISRDTFIRPVGSNHRLKLVSAVNIPIAPTKHYFKSTRDILCYTLYFPPVPKGTKSIDIIENEILGGTWFNFYGVSMEIVRRDKIIVGN